MRKNQHSAWCRHFSPTNSFETSYDLTLEIDAYDTTPHLRTRGANTGARIDSDPRSIALVDAETGPSFPLKNYVPDIDKNHKITIAPAPKSDVGGTASHNPQDAYPLPLEAKTRHATIRASLEENAVDYFKVDRQQLGFHPSEFAAVVTDAEGFKLNVNLYQWNANPFGDSAYFPSQSHLEPFRSVKGIIPTGDWILVTVEHIGPTCQGSVGYSLDVSADLYMPPLPHCTGYGESGKQDRWENCQYGVSIAASTISVKARNRLWGFAIMIAFRQERENGYNIVERLEFLCLIPSVVNFTGGPNRPYLVSSIFLHLSTTNTF